VIVVDATIAAKWYLHEADSAKAIALLANIQDSFHAPDWIEVEVASAITRRHRMGGATRAEAEMLISDWRRDLGLGRLVLEPWQALVQQAAELALAIGHGLVDCLYLACAMRLGAPLITADEKLHRRGSTAYAAVKLL
jgi:predicted nucleic acid-binding protein